jgi:hypothetical protein
MMVRGADPSALLLAVTQLARPWRASATHNEAIAAREAVSGSTSRSKGS